MEMQNIVNRPFSTHRFVKMFISAKNDEEKAEILAETIADVRNNIDDNIEKSVIKKTSDIKKDIDVSHQNLATKGDVLALKQEISGVREELKTDIQSVREELKTDIQSVREELKGDIQSVREELKTDIQSVRETILKMEIRITHRMYIFVGAVIVSTISSVFGVLSYVLR